MFDVTALGELLIDFTCLSRDGQGYPVMAAHPGGAPANFLATLAKFGATTTLLGKVGDDTFGQLLRTTLKHAKVETKGLLTDPTVFTTLAFVTLDESGNRSFSFARKPGADTQLRFEELDLSLIETSTVFHFGTLSLTHEPARTATYQAAAYAKSLGKLITFDPNLRAPLWDDLQEAKRQIIWGLSQADIIKISDEEVEFLYDLDPQAGAEHILSTTCAKLVFVTCGASGCWYATRNVCGHVNAPSGMQVIDTTGAGDIFGGAAVWKFLQLHKHPDALTEYDLYDITRFACAAASLSTTKSGGISSVPEYEEVCQLLNSDF